MCELTVVGQAFLWHQIRCIVAVLFLIGQRKEQPQVSSDQSLFSSPVVTSINTHLNTPEYPQCIPRV